MDETTPTFNLKVVIRETGIKPDTLRAWERRYKLPVPQRTAGGHRLYSQRDIDIIKWLMMRQDEGLSISKAVKLWRSLQQEGNDPLHMAAYQTADTATHSSASTSNLAALRQDWLEACLRYDESTAERVMTQAFALYPVTMVCTEILQKGLADIGALWYRNEATVQQEHFASALTMRRLNMLVAAAPAPTRLGRVLIACAPDDAHTFAPLLLTLLLRYQGWDVIYLGANVPLARFEATVETIKPNLVVLTAQMLHAAASLSDVAQLLQEKDVHIAFGGHIFNLISALRERIPGHFLGEQIQDSVQTVGKILTFDPPGQAGQAISDVYVRATAVYRQKRAAIEAETWQSMASDNVPYEHVSLANTHLSDDIMAALHLGDMAYLGTQIAWTQQLINNYAMPSDWLKNYLDAYHHSADKHLNGDGRPIVNWLDQVKSRLET